MWGQGFYCSSVVVFTFGGELADSLWLVSSLRERERQRQDIGEKKKRKKRVDMSMKVGTKGRKKLCNRIRGKIKRNKREWMRVKEREDGAIYWLITHAVLSSIHMRARKTFKQTSTVSQQVNLQWNMAGVRHPKRNVHMTTYAECYCQV